MLGLMNPYLTRICFPQELGYRGSVAFIYQFPNGITMHLIDTYGDHINYTFIYNLYNAQNQRINLRDKNVFYHAASFPCSEEGMDEFFHRVMNLGIKEEIELKQEGAFNYDDRYRLDSHEF